MEVQSEQSEGHKDLRDNLWSWDELGQSTEWLTIGPYRNQQGKQSRRYPLISCIRWTCSTAINKAWSSNAISSLSVPSVDGLASSSGSQSGTLLRLERLERTCASGERGMGKNDVNTHVVQIVDKPSQVLALQTCCTIFVFVPAEEVDELVVELR